MTAKIVKQIQIEPQQDQLLQQIARQTGISETDLVSQAIAQLLEKFAGSSLAVWESEKLFIQAHKQNSTIANARDWKREDLYDRKFLFENPLVN
jgi:hypothetical protein